MLRNRKLDVIWSYRLENLQLLDRMTKAMEATASAYGGSCVPLASWTLFERIISVHPLGGCALSTDPQDGVVDLGGEVHRYPGLFVADGSLVPGSLGFHPAMTIAALAERTAERVLGSYPR